MKLKNILICGFGVMAVASCNDYLDVDAPSSYTTDMVYSSESDIEIALNGVYAVALSSSNFGNALYNTHMLNSDVDFYANSNENANNNTPRRFDMNAKSSASETLWNNLYSSIETANEFIYNLKNSPLYKEEMTSEIANSDGAVTTKEVPAVTSLTQMMGEAKMLRAMFYHELLSYYGDIPFTLKATYETDNLLPDMTDRKVVSDSLIADLEHAAQFMYSDTASSVSAPEHITQEAVYGMIARLALQAGGYSLNHDAGDTKGYKMTRPDNYKDYYQIARNYAKKVIDAGGHHLTKDYRDVFVDECNFIVNTGDDAIFEIPFAKESTGYFGYNQGPTSSIDVDDATDYSHTAWGATSGGVRTSAFYRYQFNENDQRRDYICGTWYYSTQGLPTPRFDYSMHNNKWSKLWNTTGFSKSSTSNTGINFPYIRYADILLMFAEADNEINNGPTAAAKAAVNQVRERAYRGTNYDYQAAVNAASTKDAFLKLVLDERKFEFAGENLRWKDLVRNNMYGEALFYTYLTYLSEAEDQSGSAPYFDMVEEHDGIQYSQLFPQTIFSFPVQNYNDPNFPNTGLYMLYIYNGGYGNPQSPTGKTPDKFIAADTTGVLAKYVPVSARSITGLSSSSSSIAWTTTEVAWQTDGTPKPQVEYSLYGYIRGSEDGNIYIIDNGTPKICDPFQYRSNPSALPAVRYLYPIPEEAISRSSGKYQNYYGY